MLSSIVTLALAAIAPYTARAMSFDNSNTDSIKTTASTIARSLVSLYPANTGILPAPYYWWQSGTTLDGLLSYYHITGDTTYNALATSAILSQITPTNDFMKLPDCAGNDDQAWWALAAMSAAEYGLPTPAGSPSWLALAQNVYNELVGRWDTARCNGGMKWKIDPTADGYHYKSTIANGLFFQLAARLGRFTGDADYLSWAEKAYDWTVSVGLIDNDFNVYDGTDDAKGSGCIDVDHDEWSYNVGVFMYGAAIMADKTGDTKWDSRTLGFIASTVRNFLNNGVLFEKQCEGKGDCNTDQASFKAILARWMGATAVVYPDTAAAVQKVIGPSAIAFAGTFASSQGAGDQLAALDIVSASMCRGGNWGPGKPVMLGKKMAKRFVA
ncbi:glycoside hydrolase family 76 protein [Lepidopterella palustris CBS 459.81]|uniref:mannan endo-1,6-alpha-mannosidase n=1 Tax=Lepidopterella palustris CBS 459.81 TaxID=1314670 RepID=A0A8E2E446_9PEZI|nr:glycoside hydrolase family 76 protein [Lepidopterella palustris CBS 459.81]